MSEVGAKPTAVPHQNTQAMSKITTIGELKKAIADFNDDDIVVVEIHEGYRNEDLYEFSVDEVVGLRLVDGTEISEVRLCI
jgi:molybdopterin-guanine dinucleotide biosynthesis protein